MIQQKKSLGQHFLTNQKVVVDMLTAANVSEGDHLLEIGPGKGMLTEEMLRAGAHVTAVEQDERFVSYLKDLNADQIREGVLKLIQGDALSFSPSQQGFTPGGFKMVANIPYFITGAILRHFLSDSAKPSCMSLLMQKEVAKRIVAQDGKESILSISVKAYGTPKYIRTVSRGNFSPPPLVDSGILLIENISNDRFKNISEDHFFHILRSGFAHKRKHLISNLREKGIEANINLIEPKARPEDIDLETWIDLAR